MHFCILRRVHPVLDLYFANRRIRCIEACYLVVFDSHLTLVPHLRPIEMACQDALSQLQVLAHTSSGTHKDTILLRHRSWSMVVRSTRPLQKRSLTRSTLCSPRRSPLDNWWFSVFPHSLVCSWILSSFLWIWGVSTHWYDIGSGSSALVSLVSADRSCGIPVRLCLLLALVSPNHLDFG